MPWGIDLIPGVNVGNAFQQLITGQDRDVFSGYSDNRKQESVIPESDYDKMLRSVGGQMVQEGQQKIAARHNNSATQAPPSTVYSGSSTPNYAQQNAAAIAQLNQSAGTINNALGRLGGQLDIARGNIGTQFGQRDNELNTQRAGNQKQYNTSTTQNSQNFRSNKNSINDQASGGLRGLQRLLGSYGAVGSDMSLAGRAVSDVASQQNAGAGQTFSQNQQSLDTGWGNYVNQFDNEKKKLNDWRDEQLRGAESQSLTTRQDLLSKLADINGQIAAARGGSYASSAQPYIDQSNALSGQIDNLGRLAPTYTGNTPQYQAAELDSYDTGNGAAIGAGTPGQQGGMNTPFLNMLLNRDRRDRQFGL